MSRQRIQGIAILIAALAMIGAVPHLDSYWIRVADAVLIYTLLGMGLNLVVGYAGLLDLGFVAFYAVGAYSYALLASPQFGFHLPFLVVLPIGAAIGAILGLLLGVPVLRLRGDYLAIVTLGFGEIIRVLLNNMDAVTNGPQGIIGIYKATAFGIPLTKPIDFFWVLLIACLVCGAIVYRLECSLLGMAWAAIREDQDAARGVGINTTRAKLAAFAISAAIGGLTGVIFAAFQRYVSPDSFTLNESILIILIIVIGGVGNIFGVFLGAVMLVLLPELLREFDAYRMLVLGLVMAVVIVLRPQGLLPRRYGPSALIGLLRGQAP
jgi:branched-chain amino acid transport system permease protein